MKLSAYIHLQYAVFSEVSKLIHNDYLLEFVLDIDFHYTKVVYLY